MNLEEQKSNFDKQLSEAIRKSESISMEIKLIKSKIRKLDKIIEQANSLK